MFLLLKLCEREPSGLYHCEDVSYAVFMPTFVAREAPVHHCKSASPSIQTSAALFPTAIATDIAGPEGFLTR